MHLIILYAFCRVTDDMIDDEPNDGRKRRKLAAIERFVDELFADRRSDYDVRTSAAETGEPCVDWARYRTELNDAELSCFRALSRISFYLPKKPFRELIDGYRWDVDGKRVEDETDLLLYSSYVAGSVGTLCVYVMVYKSGDTMRPVDDQHCGYVIEKAHQMGQV